MNDFFDEYDSNATTEGLEAATLPDVIAAFKAGDSATIARAYPQVIAWLEELDGERRGPKLATYLAPGVTWADALDSVNVERVCTVASPDTERRGPA